MAPQEHDNLLASLKARFEKHMPRHAGVSWHDVQARLEAYPAALRTLQAMESTGGEPDVIGRDPETGVCTFCDCSPESPEGRRSICYDPEALEARKENKPADSAVGMASDIGIELLTEEQYRHLQTLGDFDTKTSSWVKVPDAIRTLGGGLFCDKRYGLVFMYHNGVQSYYASRGFRGWFQV